MCYGISCEAKPITYSSQGPLQCFQDPVCVIACNLRKRCEYMGLYVKMDFMQLSRGVKGWEWMFCAISLLVKDGILSDYIKMMRRLYQPVKFGKMRAWLGF